MTSCVASWCDSEMESKITEERTERVIALSLGFQVGDTLFTSVEIQVESTHFTSLEMQLM